MSESSFLGKPIEQALDGENNTVEFDIAYPLHGNLPEAISHLKTLHGNDIRLLPMSGTSSGGGIFQSKNKTPGSVVGLRFDPPVTPRVRYAHQLSLNQVGLDEIVLDPDQQQVCTGSSITLDQLGQTLRRELGHRFRVPGADLTSYRYAGVGATFMTGGMGPQRRYFSDCVSEAAIYNGDRIVGISGDALRGYAGTYGWSGIVCALRCCYYEYPENEIAFALPVSSSAQILAKLIGHLAPFTYLRLDSAKVLTNDGSSDLILGVEHVSRASLQPLLNDSSAARANTGARGLQKICDAAAADGLVFINGLSQVSVDEFLQLLVDDPQADEFTIAGIDLEHAEIFNDAEEMRALREAIPYAARMQAPAGRYVYKNHTDANVRIARDNVVETMTQLWQIVGNYVASVEQHFRAQDKIQGEILVYGHLNPYGVDPHNRVTMSCDDEYLFDQSRLFLIEQRAQYFRSLVALCAASGAIFVGGEKTADSELGIYQALGGPQHAPQPLQDRFQRQCNTIRAAAPMFSWRAPSPYI